MCSQITPEKPAQFGLTRLDMIVVLVCIILCAHNHVDFPIIHIFNVTSKLSAVRKSAQ